MKQRIYCLAILLLICHSFSSFSQNNPITGLWEITFVSIGSERMTPIARWIKLETDYTYTSGNGWLQNSKGSWTYNPDTRLLTSIDSLGVREDFEGFNVSFEKNYMVWKREENGMPVHVTLKSIKEKPMAPADYLVGLWKLKKTNLTNEDHSRIFIRWDRIYRAYLENESKSSGYWHINAHKPEVTFLPHDESENPETWTMVVNKTELILTGISNANKNQKLQYIRLHMF